MDWGLIHQLKPTSQPSCSHICRSSLSNHAGIKKDISSHLTGQRKAENDHQQRKPVISQTAVCPQKSVHFLPSKAEENKSKPIGTEKDLSFPIELQPEVLHSKMTLLVDPINVKGRKFRRLQLLSRYMNKWMDAVIFMKTLNSEAQAARRILDISTFYQTWTRQFRRRENQ
ncbi:hypothetical protein KEM48_008609 [Puccinia striiformis f. sp. tritici PST-130]|nr:hypothetical protein KEM48_008609 [Puccinia striiformis f. sp. tritici PST-130]